MNRLGSLLFFLLLVAAGLILVMGNPQEVEAHLYAAQFMLPLGFLLLLALIAGLALALVFGGPMVLRQRLAFRRLQKKYDLIYREVCTLRRMPVHEA